MPSARNKTPGVLMLLLSSLGFLIGLIIAVAAGLGSRLEGFSTPNGMLFASFGMLAFFISVLNIPSIYHSIKKLKGSETLVNRPSLFKSASWGLAVWAILVAAGAVASHFYPSSILPIFLTIPGVALPIWWLVEFNRRGLDRPSPLRGWGTLTTGLCLSPLIIITIEGLLVILVAVIVLIFLGLQPGSLTWLLDEIASLDITQSGLDQLDQLLIELTRNPVITAGIFIVIGLLAPLTEEAFKPLLVWLSFRRPMSDREGFELGLISGGAFTLLESTSLISQIGAQSWLSAVILRAATGWLHVGLSGMVGYGIARARNEKRPGIAIGYLLAAAGLHGAWNSMALINEYSAVSLPAEEELFSSTGSTLSLLCMLLVFGTVIVVNLKLNRKLRSVSMPIEPGGNVPVP